MWGNDRRAGLAAAEERLRALGERWRPGGEPVPASAADDRVRARRLVFGPWSGSALRAVALIAAVTLLVGAYWAWSGRPRAVAVGASVPAAAIARAPEPSVEPVPEPSVEPVPATSAAPEVATVVVHVVGRVARPGLVRLPAGSRVADAVEAAGGVTSPRAADSVNLARVLTDGEQVAVGVPAVAAPAAPGAGSTGSAVVDLNSADLAALDALPGVGPVLAGRILTWRQANGAFRSVDELGEVSGIGEAILSQLRPLVRV